MNTRIVPLRRVHLIPDTDDVEWFSNDCNGNCRQGRMCDCVPAVTEPINYTPFPWRVAEWVSAVILVGFLGALFIGLLDHAI